MLDILTQSIKERRGRPVHGRKRELAGHQRIGEPSDLKLNKEQIGLPP